MTNDRPNKNARHQRRPSSASAILSGKKSSSGLPGEDYASFNWMILIGTFIAITLISFLFTPYTFQLDEIKNVFLMWFPPVLLIAALWKKDFHKINWRNDAAIILLGLYFLWMVISWAVNPYKMVGERVIWFNLGVSTFTLIFAWFMNTDLKVRRTMTFFVVLGLVSTILGLFLYSGRYMEGFFNEHVRDNVWWDTEERYPWKMAIYTLFVSAGDMFSFILNSDFYAAFLVMLIPLSLSMFFTEERTGYKVLALCAALMMNLCLFLTNSNDSFIAMFLFAYPFYFILGWKHVRQWNLSKSFVLTFSGCILLFLTGIAILMWPKLQATYDFKADAFAGREVLWGGGFWPWIFGTNLHAQSPDFLSIIFGTGPGGYRHYFPWYRLPEFFDNQIANVTTFAHNFYLDVLMETGLIGLILFMGFHVRVFADGIRQIRTTQSRHRLLYQLAILTGLVGIAVQNYSSPNNRWAVAGMMYWCMFGLSIGLASLERGESTSERTWHLGKFTVNQVAKAASLAFAVVFFLRCVIPGNQGLDYWKAAVANNEGIQAMEGRHWKYRSQKESMIASEKLFTEAIKRNPTFATSYYKLAHVYNTLAAPEYLNDPTLAEQAIKTYQELDRINPNYSEVHLNLGTMFSQKSRNIPAEAALLQEETQALLAEMQKNTGAKREALKEQYDQKVEELTSKVGKMEEEQLANMQVSYEHMKEAAHQSLKPYTQFRAGETGRSLAGMYDSKGETDKANAIREQVKKYYRTLIDYRPKLESEQYFQKELYPLAQTRLLALASETNKPDEAIEILKLMVKEQPDKPIVLDALLDAYDQADKETEKLAYLEEAVRDNPVDAKLRVNLAEAYEKAGQREKAVAEYRKAEVLDPASPDVLRGLFNAYNDAGNNAKIAEYTDKATSFGVNLIPTPLETTAPETVSSSETVPLEVRNTIPTTAPVTE